ncbi:MULTISPECIES: glycosyltransferase family 4 protein [Pseudomonas]|uniref:glycosyltransferase family 4 protein n=1 Tax=Pseudomonas TaxID=286 RepID=UPI0023615786|nr:MULTISPECIES: glycosyltransferase family 4 protein [Pseudomonas]WJV27586.1 glycosyltransferase family 4 protein [Pseudomonas chlororaphis]
MAKVLHFFKTYYPDTMGGIEQVIFQISEGVRSFGIESEVLYLSPRGVGENEIYASHITHRAKRDLNIASTGMSISAFKMFKKLSAQADIIHYHFPWPFMDLMHFFSNLEKPTLVTYHSDIVKQQNLLKLYTPLMHSFLSDVDVIVASSPNYAKSSLVLQRHIKKVRVIPFGLDKSTYPSPMQKKLDYWRERVGEGFFLFVGALRYYKGLDYLLDACLKAPFPVVVAGSGPYEGSLKSKANSLGLHTVRFLGMVSDEDKVALLTLCRAIVFPSHLRSEAFGISLLEGAMFGKPMISCEIGTGTTFINIDGETGLVVSPCDPDALAEAMLSLEGDDELCMRLGGGAKLRSESVFSVDSMINGYASLYKELLAQHNKERGN